MTTQNSLKFLKVLLRRFRVVAAKVARQLNCGGVARVSWAFASMAESEGGKMVGEGRPDSDSFGLILQFDAIWEAVRMMDGSISAAIPFDMGTGLSLFKVPIFHS